jgi:nucleoside-diphosphate-sugar epimerase
MPSPFISEKSSPLLVTGANGFIGAKVVEMLLRQGFQKIRCFVRPTGNLKPLEQLALDFPQARIDTIKGNLLSPEDCAAACEDVRVIFHLAASADKTFAGSFLSSVVTTRNLLNAAANQRTLARFVNVSSFAVYSNWKLSPHAVLDEECPLEAHPMERYETYCYAKLRQEELVRRDCGEKKIPFVIVRPGAVYGPRSRQFLTPRIGIDTFGIYLHLGGGNRVPLAYVDNCAEAIVLAGLVPGVDGEAFNVVDDDLPSSREFLREYKRRVGTFKSVYIPYPLFYLGCCLWEKYSGWSRGQLPPVFNRRRCATYWKGNRYSNAKAKRLLGWTPKISYSEAVKNHCEYFFKQKQNIG